MNGCRRMVGSVLAYPSRRRTGLHRQTHTSPQSSHHIDGASVLKRSMRPCRRSLTRGCVTPNTLSSAFCVSPLEARSFWVCIMRFTRPANAQLLHKVACTSRARALSYSTNLADRPVPSTRFPRRRVH